MQNKYIIILLFTAFSQILFFPVSSHALFGIFGSRYQNVKPVNGEVVIPLNDINDGNAHYYSFNEKNSSIRFFVVKSKDNIFRAAFDACDVCFPEKKDTARPEIIWSASIAAKSFIPPRLMY